MKQKRNLIIYLLGAISLLFMGYKITSVLSRKSNAVTSELADNTKAVPLEIYLVIGQSNMAGRAEIEPQDRDSLTNVFLFTGNKEQEWEKAANPLNKYSTVRKKLSMQKLGPGYGFAREMAKARRGKAIGLVVNAKGGTSIKEWKPGGTLYNEAVSRTKKALGYGVLKGIIWHQGEANASKYNLYMPKIINLIESLRKDFNMPDLPVVVGQLSEEKSFRSKFNQMILKLPSKINNVGVVTSEGTETIGDHTHFNSASQRLMGRRYAAQMIKLIGRD